MSLYTELYDKVVQLTATMNAILAGSKKTEEFTELSPINRDALLRFSVSGVSYKLALQSIVDDIASELALGNVPVVFLPVTINFGSLGTTQSKIINKLNTSPNYVLQQGTLYIPYVQRIVLSNGQGAINPSSNFAVVTEYFMLTQRIEPNGDGITSIGIDGTTIEDNGVRYFNTVDSRSFAPVDFQLGNIGTDEIWESVNNSGPYSTPNGTTVLFNATQDGEERTWLYRGRQEEVGTGRPATVEDDFRLFPAEDETDPPPIYQETKPQQGSSDLSSVTLFLDNHEKRFIGMDDPFFQDSFLTRRLLLGGQTHCAIDTTGETEYPTVKNKWLVKMDSGATGSANIVIDSNNYLISVPVDDSIMEVNFVTAHAADILSDTGVAVIFNPDGYLEFDGDGSHTVTITNVTGTLNGTVKAVPAIMVNTPEFSEGIFDMLTEYNGYQINYRFSPRVVNGFNGFALKKYDDIDALIAGQSTQKKQAFYNVTDASDDPNLTFSVGETRRQANYRWLGTTNGDMTDYELQSAPYAVNGRASVTADTGTSISLNNPLGNECNMLSANTNSAFTLTNVKPGGEATVLINRSTEPTVTGATKIAGHTFQADTNMHLKVKCRQTGIVQYYFLKL